MAITTYDGLQSTIASFLDRDDLTSIIPTFITLAEADMSRRARHWRQEKRATATIDTQYSAVPADFYEVIRFYVTGGGTQPLELISQWQLLDRKFRRANATGEPRYYAMTAGEIEIFPVPDGEYSTELYYFAKIGPLSATETTNWMLEYFPDAYLYGALTHSAPYLKDDARLAVWSSLYQNAIDGINTDSEKAKFGGSGRRMKIRAY
jgi:hypothetical protein|tara:strand:- start:961 stop:1581 length:621 start_codon:yes stop_codon:yes gene_type:complete